MLTVKIEKLLNSSKMHSAAAPHKSDLRSVFVGDTLICCSKPLQSGTRKKEHIWKRENINNISLFDCEI